MFEAIRQRRPGWIYEIDNEAVKDRGLEVKEVFFTGVEYDPDALASGLESGIMKPAQTARAE